MACVSGGARQEVGGGWAAGVAAAPWEGSGRRSATLACPTSCWKRCGSPYCALGAGERALHLCCPPRRLWWLALVSSGPRLPTGHALQRWGARPSERRGQQSAGGPLRAIERWRHAVHCDQRAAAWPGAPQPRSALGCLRGAPLDASIRARNRPNHLASRSHQACNCTSAHVPSPVHSEAKLAPRRPPERFAARQAATGSGRGASMWRGAVGRGPEPAIAAPQRAWASQAARHGPTPQPCPPETCATCSRPAGARLPRLRHPTARPSCSPSASLPPS